MGETMGKKINLLGVEIDNYSVREAMLLMEEYLNNDCMNVVEIVSIDTLVKASEDAGFKEYMESFDMTVIGDKTILEVSEAADPGRMKETEEGMLTIQLLKYAHRNKKSVFILGENESTTEELYTYLEKEYEDLEIIGRYSVKDNPKDEDSIINEINSVTPDIILSLLESPFQEELVYKNKSKISAKLWYGLGLYNKLIMRASLKHNWLTGVIEKEVFKKKVLKFKS